MSVQGPALELGVKTDPIEYRYSFEWLFRLLAEEGVPTVQIGTFFELYQLPDVFFTDLRRLAGDFGISIRSLFTAHRELGGFFRQEPGFVEVARRNFERYIQVAALLGAESVGSNPGAVLRDWMGTKPQGLATYVKNMKELMAFAHSHGISTLTLEPMSCLAEPPTLPGEMQAMAAELSSFHRENPDSTSSIGFCLDIAHGYADREGKVVHDHWELLQAGLPFATELHLKNTDGQYHSTFGFSQQERERGIIDIEKIRDFLHRNSALLPTGSLTGYLEISGPKLGRDYSDCRLEENLRASLRYLKETFLATPDPSNETASPRVLTEASVSPPPASVQIAPSLMCSDLLHFEESIRRLEEERVDLLHLDIMDAAFAPNMPLGLEILKRLRPRTALPFDVHLMVEDNAFFIDRFAEIGAQMISVHAESSVHLDRTLAAIRSHGIKAGVALNPATPLSTLDYVLEKLDFILLMTVNPGYAGQCLVESTLKKIADCRDYRDSRGLRIPIQVDGNVSFANIPRMVVAGADILVAGTSSVFHPEGTLKANLARTRAAIDEGLDHRFTTHPEPAPAS